MLRKKSCMSVAFVLWEILLLRTHALSNTALHKTQILLERRCWFCFDIIAVIQGLHACRHFRYTVAVKHHSTSPSCSTRASTWCACAPCGSAATARRTWRAPTVRASPSARSSPSRSSWPPTPRRLGSQPGRGAVRNARWPTNTGPWSSSRASPSSRLSSPSRRSRSSLTRTVAIRMATTAAARRNPGFFSTAATATTRLLPSTLSGHNRFHRLSPTRCRSVGRNTGVCSVGHRKSKSFASWKTVNCLELLMCMCMRPNIGHGYRYNGTENSSSSGKG